MSVSPNVETSVLELDKLVTLLPAYLSFIPFSNTHDLYFFPDPSVSFFPFLAFRPLSLIHRTAQCLQVSQAPQFDAIWDGDW